MAQNNSIINITKHILIKCEIICEFLQKQNYYFASKIIKETISLLSQFIEQASSIVSSEIIGELISIFKEISSTQETNNYVLLSDTFQLKLLPLMGELQKYFLGEATINDDYFEENISKIDSQLKSKILSNKKLSSFEDFSIEFTNIGALTLCLNKNENNIYFHSNGDPYKEARYFAAEYSEEQYTDYVVFGLGLGYHINSLLEYDPRYNVTVLEPNLDVLTLALTYNNFERNLSSGRLQIKYVDSIDSITQYISSQTDKFIIHYPSLVLLDESPYKSVLKDYFMNLSSIQAHTKELNSNFHFNRKLNDLSIDVIKENFENKTIIYAGGGPSLQTRLEKIKTLLQDKNTILISAGTVYLKLLQANVIPDYVIITDPAPTLIKQIEGSKQTTTSMLYLSTASKEAVSAFNGTRYVVYQNGFDKAEAIGSQNNYTLFETGGSVSTTAIDIALRLNCKKLICIGLDLAFTNNQKHAFGIGGSVSDNSNLLSVEAVDGGYINTSNNLNIYRKWIEKRISNIHNIELINMSRGAKIHGMTDM